MKIRTFVIKLGGKTIMKKLLQENYVVFLFFFLKILIGFTQVRQQYFKKFLSSTETPLLLSSFII